MSDIAYMSAAALTALIRAGEISPVEVMKQTLKRIEALNPTVNAFVALRADQAMAEAKRLEQSIASGKTAPPLAGVPMGVKDLEDVAGMPTTYGATPYRNNTAISDSVQVQRLKKAGAIILGKTNTPEFAFTFFTKNRLFGITRNPWNTACTPGGSSGGSAAAVAGGMVPMATGSDGGGSIRTPASYCGCVGLKPTYGRIPMGNDSGPYSLVPLNPIVVAGPLARSVEDAALYLDCTAGYHPSDPSSLPKPGRSYTGALKKKTRKLRIAWSTNLGYARVQKGILKLVDKAALSFEEMGHRVEPWTGRLPNVAEAWSRLIYCDFFAQLREDIEAHRNELGKSLVTILQEAGRLTLKDLADAARVKTGLNQILGDLFDRYDLLLTPAMPTEAFDAKGPPPLQIDDQTASVFDHLAFTYPFNLSGHPAVSVPAGFTENGLPAGLQIVGPRYRDDLVLQAAYAYEQVRPWADQRPQIP